MNTEIQNLLKQNKVEEALKILNDSELIQRFQELKSKYRVGILTNSEYFIESNKIVHDILNYNIPVYRCIKCNSINVEALYWVNLNTNKISSPLHDQQYWCLDCKSVSKYINQTNEE